MNYKTLLRKGLISDIYRTYEEFKQEEKQFPFSKIRKDYNNLRKKADRIIAANDKLKVEYPLGTSAYKGLKAKLNNEEKEEIKYNFSKLQEIREKNKKITDKKNKNHKEVCNLLRQANRYRDFIHPLAELVRMNEFNFNTCSTLEEIVSSLKNKKY